MLKNIFFRRTIFLVLFSLIISLTFSCSDSSPKMGTISATLIYDFTETSAPCTQRLSVFVHPMSDEKRVSKIRISLEQESYDWLVDEPSKVNSGKNTYFGYCNLVFPDGKSFEEDQYIITFTDLAGREVSSSFAVKPLASMKDKDGKFVRSRDVMNGNAGYECALKRAILYDSDGNELYCGLYNFMFERKEELKENFPTAKSFRIFYVNKDNSCVIMMPLEKL